MRVNRCVPNSVLRLIVALVVSQLVSGCASYIEMDRKPATAKNIILFIGDGMGVSTVTAARIFDGQSKGMSGEEHSLVFENFPNVALVKTYNTNQQVPDSAGTASAMMTGEKTRAGVINIAASSLRRSCEGALESPLTPFSLIAKQRGKAIGVVTTARLTHATPAATYANSPERDWESDRFMTDSVLAQGCNDIASQLIGLAPGKELNVAMGCGRREFYGAGNKGHRQVHNADLISPWLEAGTNRVYVETAAQLTTLEQDATVLGLFSDSHMAYMAERTEDSTEPTLSDMTSIAIKQLKQSDEGYFLMVEGGRIDHGHHDARAGYAMLEAQEFARAVEAAVSSVDLSETLVLVTADHSHVFTIAGYPVRGNPILGLVVSNDVNGEPLATPSLDQNGVPYTTLGYINGPNASFEEERLVPDTGLSAVAQSLYAPLSHNIDSTITEDETHAGEDVAIYATGPGAERVRGVIEQNLIFDIMSKAFGW
jgi:alkaline phosphatase